MPEQPSDRSFPTLRRTSSNSPPYFDASKAESLVKQGGESRHVRRRVSPSRAGRYYPYTPRGYYRETLKGYTDNPLVGIPTHPQWVIPTHPQVVLPLAPKGVLPKSPSRSGRLPLTFGISTARGRTISTLKWKNHAPRCLRRIRCHFPRQGHPRARRTSPERDGSSRPAKTASSRICQHFASAIVYQNTPCNSAKASAREVRSGNLRTQPICTILKYCNT